MSLKPSGIMRKGVCLGTVFFFCLTLISPSDRLFAEEFSRPSLKVLIPAKTEIPAEYGKIEQDLRGAQGSPWVICIQDAHAVVDSQNSAKELIAYLMERYGIGLVGLEGGKGKMDSTLLRSFPDEKIKKKIMQEYLERGELSGAEMAAVLNVRESAFYGIEDMRSYEENYAAYLNAMKVKPQIEQKIRFLYEKFDEERKIKYLPEFNSFHEAVEKFRSENGQLLELLRYFETLPGTDEKLNKFPQLKNLFLSVEKDAALDKENIDAEIRGLADSFRKTHSRSMGKGELMEFNKNYQGFVTGTGDAAAFLNYLIGEAEKRGEGLSLSVGMKEFLGQTETLAAIKGTRLFEELEQFIREYEEDLAATAEAKELLSRYRKLRLLRELSALEVSREQLAVFLADKPTFYSLIEEKWLEPAENFYRWALDRDGSLSQGVELLLKRQKANAVIVLAGGFHSKGLEEMLKKKNYSYTLITPAMSSLKGHERYGSLMDGDLSYKKYIDRSFYDGFMRDISLKFSEEFKETDFKGNLKKWRDDVLRRLAKDGRLEAAGKYTHYIDSLLKVYGERFGKRDDPDDPKVLLDEIRKAFDSVQEEAESRLSERFKSQIRFFVDGLQNLIQADQIKKEKVIELLRTVDSSGNNSLIQLAHLALMPEADSERLREFVRSGTFPVARALERVGVPVSDRGTVLDALSNLSESEGILSRQLAEDPSFLEGQAEIQLGIETAKKDGVVPGSLEMVENRLRPVIREIAQKVSDNLKTQVTEQAIAKILYANLQREASSASSIGSTNENRPLIVRSALVAIFGLLGLMVYSEFSRPVGNQKTKTDGQILEQLLQEQAEIKIKSYTAEEEAAFLKKSFDALDRYIADERSDLSLKRIYAAVRDVAVEFTDSNDIPSAHYNGTVKKVRVPRSVFGRQTAPQSWLDGSLNHELIHHYFQLIRDGKIQGTDLETQTASSREKEEAFAIEAAHWSTKGQINVLIPGTEKHGNVMIIGTPVEGEPGSFSVNFYLASRSGTGSFTAANEIDLSDQDAVQILNDTLKGQLHLEGVARQLENFRDAMLENLKKNPGGQSIGAEESNMNRGPPAQQASGSSAGAELSPEDIAYVLRGYRTIKGSPYYGVVAPLRQTDGEPAIIQPWLSEIEFNDRLASGRLDLDIGNKNVVSLPGYASNGFALSILGKAKTVTITDLDPVTIAWLKAVKKFWDYRGQGNDNNPARPSIGEFMMNGYDVNGRQGRAFGYSPSEIQQFLDLILEAVETRPDLKTPKSYELQKDIRFAVSNTSDLQSDPEGGPFVFVYVPNLFGRSNGIERVHGPGGILDTIEGLRKLAPQGRVLFTPKLGIEDYLFSLGYQIVRTDADASYPHVEIDFFYSQPSEEVRRRLAHSQDTVPSFLSSQERLVATWSLLSPTVREALYASHETSWERTAELSRLELSASALQELERMGFVLSLGPSPQYGGYTIYHAAWNNRTLSIRTDAGTGSASSSSQSLGAEEVRQRVRFNVSYTPLIAAAKVPLATRLVVEELPGEEALVVYGKKNGVIVVNAARFPDNPSVGFYDRLKADLVRVAVRLDFEEGTGFYREGFDPFAPQEKGYEIPRKQYDRAVSDPSRRAAAENEFAQRLFTVKDKSFWANSPPSRDLPGIERPKIDRDVVGDYLSSYVDDISAGNTKAGLLYAANFEPVLRGLFLKSLDEVLAGKKVPASARYQGDVWELLSRMKNSRLVKEIEKNAKVDGGSLSGVLSENRSSFFRQSNFFMNLKTELRDKILQRVKTAKREKEKQIIELGVFGAGFNEEAISMAIVFRDVIKELEAEGQKDIRDLVDYKIVVFSRPNLVFDALVRSNGNSAPYPLIYPGESLGPVSGAQRSENFDIDGNSYRPKNEILSRIEYKPLDLMDPQSLAAAKKSFNGRQLDVAAMHNVMVYLKPQIVGLNPDKNEADKVKWDGIVSEMFKFFADTMSEDVSFSVINNAMDLYLDSTIREGLKTTFKEKGPFRKLGDAEVRKKQAVPATKRTAPLSEKDLSEIKYLLYSFLTRTLWPARVPFNTRVVVKELPEEEGLVLYGEKNGVIVINAAKLDPQTITEERLGPVRDRIAADLVRISLRIDLNERTGFYRQGFDPFDSRLKKPEIQPAAYDRALASQEAGTVLEKKFAQRYVEIDDEDFWGRSPATREFSDIQKPKVDRDLVGDHLSSTMGEGLFTPTNAGVMYAANYGKTMTRSLALAFNAAQAEQGVPTEKRYRGNIWELILRSRGNGSGLTQGIEAKAMIADSPYAMVIQENRSSFFRESSYFNSIGAKFKELILQRIEMAKQSGKKQKVQIGIIGAGFNEDALSNAIIFEETLDQLEKEGYKEVRAQVDYGINVFSRPNIVFNDLKSSEGKPEDYPLVYPSAAITDVSEQRKNAFFAETEDGFKPQSAILSKIRYFPVDLLDQEKLNGAIRTKKGGLDILTIHNVLTYLKPFVLDLDTKGSPEDAVKWDGILNTTLDFIRSIVKGNGEISVTNSGPLDPRMDALFREKFLSVGSGFYRSNTLGSSLGRVTNEKELLSALKQLFTPDYIEPLVLSDRGIFFTDWQREIANTAIRIGLDPATYLVRDEALLEIMGLNPALADPSVKGISLDDALESFRYKVEALGRFSGGVFWEGYRIDDSKGLLFVFRKFQSMYQGWQKAAQELGKNAESWLSEQMIPLWTEIETEYRESRTPSSKKEKSETLVNIQQTIARAKSEIPDFESGTSRRALLLYLLHVNHFTDDEIAAVIAKYKTGDRKMTVADISFGKQEILAIYDHEVNMLWEQVQSGKKDAVQKTSEKLAILLALGVRSLGLTFLRELKLEAAQIEKKPGGFGLKLLERQPRPGELFTFRFAPSSSAKGSSLGTGTVEKQDETGTAEEIIVAKREDLDNFLVRYGERIRKRLNSKNFWFAVMKPEEIAAQLADTEDREKRLKQLEEIYTKLYSEMLSDIKLKMQKNLKSALAGYQASEEIVNYIVSDVFEEKMRKELSFFVDTKYIDEQEVETVLMRVRNAVYGEASEAIDLGTERVLRNIDQAKVDAFSAQLLQATAEWEKSIERQSKPLLVINNPGAQELEIVAKVLGPFVASLERLGILLKKGQHLNKNDYPFKFTPFNLDESKPEKTIQAINQSALGANPIYAFTADPGKLAPILKGQDHLLASIGKISNKELQELAYKASILLLLKLSSLPKDQLLEIQAQPEKLKKFIEDDPNISFLTDKFGIRNGTPYLNVPAFLSSFVSEHAAEERVKKAA